MTEIEAELLAALRRLEEVVASTPVAGPRPELGMALARIGELGRRLPGGTAPELLHYLNKRSHEKARLFLEGKDPEPGACHH